MIIITRTPTGLLLMRDTLTIELDTAAIPTALGPLIRELMSDSTALALARREGYEAGPIVGHANGMREAEDRMRREAEQFAEGLALLKMNAPLAA
jgi:hypothetical protein